MTDARVPGDDRVTDEQGDEPALDQRGEMETEEEEEREDEEGGSVFGPRPDEGAEELVPGQPAPENALFVVLGVATTVALVAALVGLL